MAWCGLIRVWDPASQAYRQLVLRIEESPDPGYFMRLYDGQSVAGEVTGATAEDAVAKAVELARQYLQDDSITPARLSWMEI
jgi:hypothetical protein